MRMPLKRKRPDRPSGDGARPSPHRPADTPMAQHDREDGGGRLGGGRGRGGRGGFNRRDSNPGHGRGGHHYGQQQQTQQTPTTSRNASFSGSAQSPTVATAKQPRPSQSPSLAKQSAPSPTIPANRAPAIKQSSDSQASKTPHEPVKRQPSPKRPKYHYDNLTDDRVQAWNERGRDEVARHGSQSREDVDITELSSLFQEFIHAVIDGRLDAADAGACVKEILGHEEITDVVKNAYSFAPHTLFLDTLSIVMDNDSDLYRPALRDFLVATGVSPALMREVLDAPLLQQLGLIRDTFARLGVRQATNLLYRQANYNLLREESEGYSKLITEIFTTNSIPPPPPSKTFEKVKALIGTFDLDVGRVLDVVLDVAATILIKQVKFFVKFLRVSSWWPSSHLSDGTAFVGGLPTWAAPGYPTWNTSEKDEAENVLRKLERDVAFWNRCREVQLAAFFELGGRRVTDRHLQQKLITNGNAGEDVVANVEQEWVKETNTLPAPGNRVAAQLLGFKLRFYNSDMRDKTDVLPANLLYLASLLIKIGFISLTDLWPHLSPADDQMEKVRQDETERLEKQERESRGGQMNALLTAGVLPQGDDDSPNPTNSFRKELPKKADQDQKKAATAEESQNAEKLPEPLEQKVSLLTQLLTIGAIPESLFILGRFPWIPEVFPDVLQRIHRILHVSLEKVYKDSQPPRLDELEFPVKDVADADQAGVPKGHVRLTKPPQRKIWRWPYPDACDTNESQNFRFYLDEWSDNVPVCQTVDDVFALCGTFLNLSGVNIGKDEALLSKLASIGAKSLATDKSDANRARWQDLLRRLLLPALSHTKANASVVNAIWELVKQYPLITRYSMYAEWFEGQISRMPAMRTAFARATSETRATMKRVSLTNLSEMAKRLAKTSYASPGIVFKVAFEQLEVYSNLIEAFVECAKYFTDLSYDVLVWSLLNSLGKSRSRTQAEHALTTSKWLQALSRFSGKVFRRYPVLTPIPVLQYVDDQLSQGNATDLIILKEFISSMGGIVDAADFTDYQILSMAGGNWLRRHTLIRAQDKRFENTKSSARLIQALSDSKLAAQLLINLAQHRQAAVYKVPEEEAHIKFLSSTIDDSHQTLVQYLDFLWTNLDPDTFDIIVPSIPQLISSFGLSADLAFLIGRSSLAHRMLPWKEINAESIAKKDSSQARKPGVDKEGDVKMSDAKTTTEATDATSQGNIDVENPQKPDDPSLSRTALTTLQPIAESLQVTVRPEVWQKMTPELYTAFWALQLGDVCFPQHIYIQERQKVMSEWQTLANDRSDTSRRAVDRKMEKRKELIDMQGFLLEELSEHCLRKAKWKFFLTKTFQNGFPKPAPKPDVISDVLLEQCFLPRLLLSASDAEYTFRFIRCMHDWNAPAFRLMSLYDRLFNANRLRGLIFTCTVREAEYLGRFLKLILQDLLLWHKNDPLPADKDNKAAKNGVLLGCYDKEGKGTSDQPRLGFALTFNEQGKPVTFVEHAQFRDLLFRWHKNLNMALKSCLGGSEWMHIRNAITILRSVLDFFPAVDFMASQFTAQLQKITKREAAPKTSADSEDGGRVDLSVAAQGAMSELQKRKSKWVMVQAFRSNAAGGSRSEAEKPGTSNLRPTAPDFKPQPSKPPASKTATAEEEDGEVRDAVVNKANPVKSAPTQPARPAETAAKVASKLEETSESQSANARTAQSHPSEPRSHGLPDRPTPHNLPRRPDVPIPGHVAPERYSQSRGPERRDVREARTPRDARVDPREGWEGREVRETRESKEHREVREPRPMEPERPGRPAEYPERRAVEVPGDNSRPELPPRPGQQDRDRQYRDTRSGRPGGRYDATTYPPGPPVGNEPSEPVMNPERAAFFAQDSQDRPPRGPDTGRQPRPHRQLAGEPMDMASAERGPMDDRNDVGHFPQNRGRRDDGHDRGPRPPSPRRAGRHDQEYGPPPGSFDDRHGRPYPPEQRSLGRDPRERSPMTGPNFRGERPMDRELERGMDKMRDPAPNFPRSGPRMPDAEHRLPHQDHNYGRLNPVPSPSDAPSGPRGRGRSTTRGGYGANTSTPSRVEGRFGGPETPRAPSPDRIPPTGPASGRSRRGGYEPASGPGTPSNMHGGGPPDRARNFGGPAGDMQASPAAATPPSVVHPDRLAQMGSGPPSSSGPPHSHGRHVSNSERHAPSSRPPHPGSMGPPLSAEVVNAPTGPASSSERMRNGGGRRQLAGINNTLQQSQSMPDLNRSGGPRGHPRQLLGNSDAQVLTGGPPAAPSQERHDTAWQDNANWVSANGNDGGPRRDRGERESRGDRPGRSSRRSSREREHDRGPHGGREVEPKDMGDYQNRRPMGNPDLAGKEREPRRPPRDVSGRNSMGAPPSGGRDLTGPREPRAHPEGGPGGNRPMEDWSGGGGGGGGGGYRSRGGPREGGMRPPEERREPRDDRGRKRRSEDGVGLLASERDKRPRRG